MTRQLATTHAAAAARGQQGAGPATADAAANDGRLAPPPPSARPRPRARVAAGGSPAAARSPGRLPRALLGGLVLAALATARAQPAEPPAAAPVPATGVATLLAATPQGRVGAAVRQVRARLDRALVPLGQGAGAADPLLLRCTGLPGGATAPAGRGRFTGEREWVFDLVEPLPPGAACEVRAAPGGPLATVLPTPPSAASGAAPTPAADGGPPRAAAGVLAGGRWRFDGGGPAVVQVRPWPGSAIDEAQHLVVTFNGPVVPASVVAVGACEVQGVADRLPVRLVEGAERDATLAAQAFRRPGSRAAAAIAARSVVLACARPLPPDARVRLLVGPGVRPVQAGAPAGTDAHASTWTVRPAFTAEFSCERERADAPCWPVRPLTVRFSAPVARESAARVRLVTVDAQPPRAWAAVIDAPADEAQVQDLRFPVPLPERARLRVELPADLRDDAGRPLANAARFPLAVATGDAPPIAKFAAAPFGILERGPAGTRRTGGEPVPAGVLPITLRHVQADFADAAGRDAPPGVVRTMRLTEPAEILAWIGRLQRHHEQALTAREAGRPRGEWFEWETVTDAAGRERRVPRERSVGTREVSLLRADSPVASGRIPPAEPPPGVSPRGFVAPPPPAAPPPLRRVQRLALPPSPDSPAGAPRPFEVVGLPLAEPGYHVVEVESARLGASLLDRAAPLFVRTGVLVTNLGVHLKHGRENSVVWVTTLDRARPVAGAEVLVHDCRGTRLWQGTTDASGLARIDQPLDAQPPARRRAQASGTGWDAPDASCVADEGLFVVARTTAGSPEGEDLAFVSGSWQRGIEPWRFDLPVADASEGAAGTVRRAHTVFDRTLLRAGETVSMKHFLRIETRRGLALPPAAERPDTVVVEHVGSGQETRLPLDWAGQRSATSSWAIPPAARLGAYAVSLERRGADGAVQRVPSGGFRVEAFRVPLVDARLVPPAGPAVAPRELPLAVQVQYLAGGGVAQRNATVSALLVPRTPVFAGVDGFRFDPPRPAAQAGDPFAADEDPGGGEAGGAPGRVVADRVPAPTDARGAGQVRLAGLPALDRPAELQAELAVDDPSGERQTTVLRIPLWPAARVAGVQAPSFGRRGAPLPLQAVVLDTDGRALADQPVVLSARLTRVTTVRRRLVGGFYGYDNRVEREDLGTVCEGRTDARGRFACEARVDRAGDVEIVATATDPQGRRSEAATPVWLGGAGDAWFAQDDDDRIALVPDRTRWSPGETARIQVRMPFREATVLVSVEREGVIDTRVQRLRADDPVIRLPIEAGWAPNVVVSVAAVRGRVREVPWTSFFDWGWREPLAWWRAWRDEGPDHVPPTALVDLAKPSFKLGATGLSVDTGAQALQVTVVPDRDTYRVRETVQARVRVTQGGRPLAAPRTVQLAFAAVDEGLLALRPNDSWALLDGLLQPRPWAVATATGHAEIVGRRHYGRKAVAAGGGGGRGATRELFDTLLVWRARVPLDANGEAVVPVPLNDSLTGFRLVAVADALADDGTMAFGTGEARVRVTQELQLLPGLPLVVREGDRFDALMTVRNTTARELPLTVTLAADGLSAVPAQSLVLPAGASRELAFPVGVPGTLAATRAQLTWTAEARETAPAGGAAPARPLVDRVQRVQAVQPAVPVRAWASTVRALDAPLEIPVAPPAGALADGGRPRGGVSVGLQATLADGLPGVRAWFEAYPFTCLEQQASRAIALGDAARWSALVTALPSYRDDDGLVAFFPPSPGTVDAGSDRLTAHLLAAADAGGLPLPVALRDTLLAGLLGYVEGRVERPPSPYGPGGAALDRDVRRLAAMAVLARHGRLEPRHLGVLRVAPATWPTAALLDWIAVLRAVERAPQRAERLAEAQQALRARLVAGGSELRFAQEAGDDWWWLMDNADANAGRLILAVLDDPAWRDDLPRLVLGHLARQRQGAWSTTTANLWGTLALRAFGRRFEATPVAGRTVARLGGVEAAHDWAVPGAPPSVPAAPGPSAPASARPTAAAPPSAASGVAASATSRPALSLPWPTSGAAPLALRHDGAGRPWATVLATAAVVPTAPVEAGYRVRRTVTPVTVRTPGRLSRGDVVRVELEIDALDGRTWVAVADPLPAGATVLGSGLGGDSAMARQVADTAAAAAARATGEPVREARPTWVERAPGHWQAFFADLPRGRHRISYTVRLSNAGRFSLPPTRVEAMYAPDTFAERPNVPVEVAP